MKILKSITRQQYALFYGFALLSVLSIILVWVTDQNIWLGIPVAVCIGYITITNYRILYFALLFLVPLSVETELSKTLSTDFPTEPIMVVLLCVVLFRFFGRIKETNLSLLFHPLIGILSIHLFWIGITSFTSTVPLFSFKFFVAKLWYIASFIIATFFVVRSAKDVKIAFWCIYSSLTVMIIVALIRHALIGFSFDDVNSILRPFYRNHVNYAAIITLFFPFVLMATQWYNKGTFLRNMLYISVPLYLIAIYFSYSRACYVATAVIFCSYFIFQWRLTKYAIAVSFCVVAILIGYITHENRYVQYTPTVKTVTQVDFDDLIEATFKGEDVSSMERIYRWVAAAEMIQDRPIFGFGPNGFVSNYKNYTVFIFETWISDNEERSGVHNYFLMTVVEQGLPGLLIFVVLLCVFFLYGENVYHRADFFSKWLVMASLLSMIGLVINLIFSDMIEVDKTGSFFFLNIAFVVFADRINKGLHVEKINPFPV